MDKPHPSPHGKLDSNSELPLELADVNTAWFKKIFNLKIKEVSTTQIIPGTATKVLVQITYEENYDESIAPKSVCVKGGFDPALRALSLNVIYRREAEFFYHLAPQLAMRLPKPWYCGSDLASGQGIVVLSDLVAANCTFGECTEAWPVERIRSGLDQLAILHAKTWGATEAEYSWIKEEFSMRDVIVSLFAPSEWDKRFLGDAKPPVADYLVDRERMFAGFKTMWKLENPKYKAVVHGDSHIGNTYILPNGEPAFLDWQGVHISSVFHDVAYFISGSLSIEDRRAHERDLVGHYLEMLHKSGAPEFTVDEVWVEYRKHMLHGFAWALAGPLMQTKERVDIMSERHSTAIVDHKSLELLEALQKEAKGEEPTLTGTGTP